MARMRTVNQVMEYLRRKDPNSAITEWWLRENLRNGTIHHHKAGNKYLINLDYLEEFLNNPSRIEDDENETYGTIRKVK